MTACATCGRLVEENQQLTQEVSGLLSTTRRQAREIVALKQMLRERMEEDPLSKDVRRVLDRWAETHPQARTPADGKRAKVVRRALRLGHDVDELLEALDGLRRFPFVTGNGRS